MKAQGIRLGPAPYGYEMSMQLDEKGRRLLVPLASEQAVIARLATAQADGVGFSDIARQLNAEGVPLVYDKPAAAARARELRAEKLSLRLIGVRLRQEGLAGRSADLAAWAKLLAHPSMRGLPEQARREGIVRTFRRSGHNGVGQH